MQFAGKNSFDVGDKEIVVHVQIKFLKIDHKFSSEKEKYLESVMEIIQFLPIALKNKSICFEKRILYGVLSHKPWESPYILTSRPYGSPTTVF